MTKVHRTTSRKSHSGCVDHSDHRFAFIVVICCCFAQLGVVPKAVFFKILCYYEVSHEVGEICQKSPACLIK